MKSKRSLPASLALAAAITLLGQPAAPAQNSAQNSNIQTNTQTNTQTNSTPPGKSDVIFSFPAGSPRDFLTAVEKTFKVDWWSVTELPRQMENLRIPRLRITTDSLEPLLRHDEGTARAGLGDPASHGPPMKVRFEFLPEAARRDLALRALIALYTSLEEAKPELGRLKVEEDYTRPSVVLFVAGRNAAAEFKIRIYSLKGIPEAEWPKTEQMADEICGQLMDQYQRNSHFNIRLHSQAGLLILTGPEYCMEAVESLLAAWKSNQAPSAPPPSGR